MDVYRGPPSSARRLPGPRALHAIRYRPGRVSGGVACDEHGGLPGGPTPSGAAAAIYALHPPGQGWRQGRRIYLPACPGVIVMTDVVILGIGIHPFGRFDASFQALGSEAARLALKDAGVEWKQIEFAYLSRMYLPATSGARILKTLGCTGIPIVDVEAACASGGAALRQAVLAIRSGEADLGLVLGVEKMPRGFMDPSMIYSPWQIEMGLSLNPAYWSMRARRHMHDFGTTEEQIARVAYKNHKNSVHNPNSMYQKEFSMEEIMHSPLVCDPIRRLEICAPNDGAAALVVASAARERQFGFTGKPINIASCVHTIARYSADLRCPIDSMSAKAANPGPTEE